MPRTADFQDANNNGEDDRDEKRQDQSKPRYSERNSYGQGNMQSAAQDFDRYFGGNFKFGNIMSGVYGEKIGEDDDEGRALKRGFAYETLGKAFDSALARGDAQFQSGLAQNLMGTASNLARQEQSEARREEFVYGNQSRVNEYELKNQMANQNYKRDIGFLGAENEQARMNMREKGNIDRLQTVTEGEQTRKNYEAKGVQDRLQTVTEGEQERLNIGTRGDQERKTLSHEDKLRSAEKRRDRSAARSAARAF